ncbi:MAG: dephospho-CoA kinase [Chloroflexi bacterium]|jgi:dephospho-CoA kinase|uniref:Dephospho-CoA kinase n=1 Tax=Candidatus Thermofonsia Clade 3 bacterium TaxID=2364212 RepID=A0A2M8QEC9_9CHLR|nr:dephospho-CoA kinase [Candidatus Roseilinea sp. NK_OTU-006]PJF48159.1 MAG: dephospho-CoA kinase [Candidatus Thermofonsia Clade 3 bacterium]RMG61953.1 MAG: dephospho-CoA kinase [Chloroflexota bacterium]
MPRLLIGLTGNIATGKSTVARMLRELGAVVIDADQVAREVVRPGQPTLDQIVRTFGSDVLLPNGALDRSKMARLVFGDADRLKQLEAIIHPAVREAMWRAIRAQPDDAVVVIEVIKLFESGWARECDQVWVTHCPPEMQVARLVSDRGLSLTEARMRVEAQNPQADKLARADVVIDTSGSLEDTRQQVETAWMAARC